jgi:hypothetical protein
MSKSGLNNVIGKRRQQSFILNYGITPFQSLQKIPAKSIFQTPKNK